MFDKHRAKDHAEFYGEKKRLPRSLAERRAKARERKKMRRAGLGSDGGRC